MRVIYYGRVPKPISVELELELYKIWEQEANICAAQLDITYTCLLPISLVCTRRKGHDGMHAHAKRSAGITAEWEGL